MSHHHRICALFIALCLSLPMLFSGCGESAVTETEATGTVESVVESQPVETREPHQVPEQDFGGATFHSYAIDWQGYCFYFFAEEATGDVMNDAIYDRTLLIEEYLNVDMTSTLEPDYTVQVATVKQQAQAGDDVYQEVLLHCIYGVEQLSAEGYLYPYEELPYIDLSADWWNQEQMDVLRLGDKTYFGISDYMIPCPYVIFVNRNMVEDRGLDDPYTLVYDKKWTIDKCFSMITEVAGDADGDGQLTENDNWGISAEEISKYVSFVTGCGQFMTEMGSDGHIQLAMNTEKMVSIVEKLYAVVSTPGGVYMPVSANDSDMFDFDSGRMLFYMDAVSDVVKFRDYESLIGILPYPMYDEEQEDYISLDWGGLQCVMGQIQDPQMVGAVLELQAYYSKETVIPAYYDVLLDGKIARDEDTVKMLDIVFDTIAYEVGGNYFGFSSGFDNLFFTVGRMVVNDKSADFASFYAKNEKSAQNTIEKYYKALED